MLTEERYNIILELLREKRSVTVAEIKDRLGISESTIRRDLNALAQEGKLTKVFGGAVAPDNVSNGIELSVPQKLQVNEREKRLMTLCIWMQERQPDICWSIRWRPVQPLLPMQ